MRRYPFTVPGMVRLTSGGGASVVDRLRGAMEPLVMAIIHRFDQAASVKAVSSDELHTLDGDEFPKEWWVRTAIVPSAAEDPSKAVSAHGWPSIQPVGGLGGLVHAGVLPRGRRRVFIEHE